MFVRQNPHLDKPLQLLDFVSLKKKNPSKQVSSHHSKITFHPSNQTITIPIILAIYQLTSTNQIKQDLFATFNFDQPPKQYHTYAHQKTMKAFLKLIASNADSQTTLVSFLDQFPIIGFVLEAYSRAVCMNFVESRKELFLHGNQQQTLENFSFEVRGNLLNLMVDALSVHLTLIIGDIIQNYGSEGNKKKLQIKYSEEKVQAQLTNGRRKQNGKNELRINGNNGTKNLKHIPSMETQTSESHQVSSIESNSIMKEVVSQIVRCEKCRLITSKCLCSKKMGSVYTTPKSVTSNNGGRSPVPGVNGNIFSVLNHSKCVCHKIICTCRK